MSRSPPDLARSSCRRCDERHSGNPRSRAPAFSRHQMPESCSHHRPSNNEGAGSTGCTLHPRLACKQRTPQVRRSRPALPAQWFTAYTCSPRGTGLDSPRRLAGRNPRDLIPASGDQDHTISLVRFQPPLVARPRKRPSRPAPTSVTTRPPLLPGRDGAQYAYFLVFVKRYFRFTEIIFGRRYRSSSDNDVSARRSKMTAPWRLAISAALAKANRASALLRRSSASRHAPRKR
jgi:hypothetical protein